MIFFEVSYVYNLNLTYLSKNSELKERERERERTNVIYVNQRNYTLIYINPIYEIDTKQLPNIKKYPQVCKAPLKFNNYSLKKTQ